MFALTAAALSAIVIGHPAPVTCGTTQPGYAGQTWFNAGVPFRIDLAAEVCRDLAWRFQPATWMPTAVAAATVIHEAEHYRYADMDEAVTECRMRRDYLPTLADALPHADGLDRYVAGRYIYRMAADMLVNSAALPADYQGGVC